MKATPGQPTPVARAMCLTLFEPYVLATSMEEASRIMMERLSWASWCWGAWCRAGHDWH